LGRLPARSLLRRDRRRAAAARGDGGSDRRRGAPGRAGRGLRRRCLAARVPGAAGGHARPLDDQRHADDPDRRRALRGGRARVAPEPERRRAACPRARPRHRDLLRRLQRHFRRRRRLLRRTHRRAARRGALGCGDRGRARCRLVPGRAHGAARAPLRAARAGGRHPLLLARERAAGRAALLADDRARGGDRPLSYRFAFGRPPAVAAEAMVATSQPLATRAGLRALERGGTAADAALAAAAVLCVTEPMSTGIGGDCFAQVWQDGELAGLDAAGPAPASADPLPVDQTGPRSVTVPGAVAGWAAFAERYCRLGLDTLLEDAIDAAEAGFAVAPRTAAAWQRLG